MSQHPAESAASTGPPAGATPPDLRGERPGELPRDLLRDLPGDRPPKRLLDRAPSDRLASQAAATSHAGASDTAGRGSGRRATAWGVAAAAGGTLIHLVAATLLLWTGGLLVVAVTIGIAVGLAVAAGAGSSLAPRPRRGLALALALGSVVLACGLSWALSGMYLGPLDYLAQVYGLLVPVQLALASAGALAGSR